MTGSVVWPPCPSCGMRRDGMAPVTERGTPGPPPAPTPGAFVICAHCGHVAAFDDGPFGLTLRTPSDDELAALMQDPKARAVVAEIRRMVQEIEPDEKRRRAAFYN